MILTFQPVYFGLPATVTLSKSELLSLPAVAADPYFSQAANVSRVVVEFGSSIGAQREILNFDFSQPSPTAQFQVSERARNSFLIRRIILSDFDGGVLVLDRPQLPSGLDVQVAQVPTLEPTPDAFVSMLSRFNGNATETISNLPSTVHGTVSYVPGISGQALDASAGAISYPVTDQFHNPGASSWTVEMWVKPLSSGINTDRYFLRVGPWAIGIYNNNKILFDWFTIANSALIQFFGPSWPTVTHDAWHHVALSYNAEEGANGGFRFFVNGVMLYQHFEFLGRTRDYSFDGQTTCLVGAYTGSAPQAGIGFNSPLQYQSKCHIDNFRVTKGLARYTANFTPAENY